MKGYSRRKVSVSTHNARGILSAKISLQIILKTSALTEDDLSLVLPVISRKITHRSTNCGKFYRLRILLLRIKFENYNYFFLF